MWIFGSFPRDAMVMIAPGLIGALCALTLSPLSGAGLLFLFVVTAIIDSGHVYTTSWRVFRSGRESSAFRASAVLLPIVFLVSFVWIATGLPGFWSAVIYFTLFHHVRQSYGVSRWYQGLNQRYDKISDAFLYALTLLPVFIFHFRENVGFQLYTPHDLLVPGHLSPDLRVTLFNVGSALYTTVLICWITRETLLFKSGRREWNRVSSVAIPAIVHGAGFLIAPNLLTAALPLMVAHGVAYISLVALGETRLTNGKRSLAFSLILVALTAAIFGALEAYVSEDAFYDYQTRVFTLAQSALAAALVTPLLWHYLVDGFIWRRKDPDAARIFVQKAA